MSVDGTSASGSMPQMAQPSLIGEVLDGRYKIIKLLGEGGMGQVYAAEHVHIEKRYAIKLLRPEIVSNAEAVSRFRQEARSSSSIGHRNIIAIEDFGALPDGRIYMCMELLNGAALNDLITQPLSVERLLNILIQTGHGLAAAHAKNIVHRDMKPENIFVTIGPNGEDIPKILDFGIAKVAGNEGGNHLTRTGTIFGTPFYMAPEQALGNPVDQRTDIYAMGVIAYEVFSGSLPFQGESFMGILTQHITTEAEPVAQRAAKAGRQLPAGLAEIVTRCMRKNPAERFATMDELVNALIQVYRTIAGAGMSSYLEAFPVGQSAPHNHLTPGALGSSTGTPSAATTPPSGMYNLPQQGGGNFAPTPMPMQPGPSRSVGAVSASPSGTYDPAASVIAPKKGKGGLIAAIVVVLALGGGAAAFVVWNNGRGAATPPGSGSQVAIKGGLVGSNHVTTAPVANPPVTDPGPGPGSTHPQTVVTDGSGSAVAVAPAGSGTATPPPAGSGTTVPAGEPHMDVFVETKPFVEKFEIWENDKKVDDDDTLTIAPKSRHDYVLKAKGFKDTKFTVDGTAKKVVVAVARLPGPKIVPIIPPGPGSGSPGHPGPGSAAVLPPPPPPPPPQHPDCSQRLKDHRDPACRKQFCATHPDFPACNLEP